MVPETIGKYKIVQPLGSGGMASVYEGVDPLIDRRVAIKVLHPHLEQDPNFSSRFRQEARVVASLRHPHIVRLYDFDVDDHQPFMVMEYLDGGTLQQKLTAIRAEGQRLPLGAANQMLAALADALEYAHAHGAVHRDIKPANIMFTPDGQPVVTDFGIAKLLHDSMQISITGGLIGTPAYMSPEQASGSPLDGRSDQYSLAIVQYEMASGRVPFVGDAPTGVLMQHLTEQPPPPRSFNPNLPQRAEDVLLRALAKDPQDRFASVKAFAAAFDAALRGERLPAQETTGLADFLGATQVDDDTAGSTLDRPGGWPSRSLAGDESAAGEPASTRGEAGKSGLARLRSIPPRILGIGAGAATLLAVQLFFAFGGPALFAFSTATPPATSPPAAGTFTIAVADYDGSEASVTADLGRRVFEQLESELSGPGSGVRVIRTNEVYTDAQRAVAAGEALNASLVIWGWYDDLGVSTNIEQIERRPVDLPGTRGSSLVGTARAAGPGEDVSAQIGFGDYFSYLRIPRLVSDLAFFADSGPQQLAYIAEAVLGLAYHEQGDLAQALAFYDRAIENRPAGVGVAGAAPPGLDLVYFQRAVGRYELGQINAALADLEAAAGLNPDLYEAQYNLAVLYPETCTPARQLGAALQAAQAAAALKPVDVAARRLLAGLYGQLGRYPEAFDEAEAALKLAPDDAQLHLLLGELYGATGRVEEAQAAVDYGLALSEGQLAGAEDPHGEKWISLGDAFLQAGRLEEAVTAYERARGTPELAAEVQRGLGSAALQSRAYPVAIQAFQLWTNLEPENPAALEALALAHWQSGDPTRAIDVLQETAALTGCDATSRLLLGGIYWEQEEYALAEDAFRQAAAIEPYNATTLYFLGVSQRFQDNLDGAAASLDEALSLNPDLDEARYARGTIYYEQGAYEPALEAWRLVVARQPDNAAAWTSLGNAHEKLEDNQAAIEAYQTALALEDTADVRWFLGLVFMEEQALDLAIGEFEQAVELEDNFVFALSSLGEARLQTGDLPGAVDAYRQALAQEEDTLTRLQLATALTRLGQLDAAIIELENGLSSDEPDLLILSRLGNLFARMGRLDEAESQYNAMLAIDSTRPDAHAGLGSLAYKRCRLSDMESHYGQAAELGAGLAIYEYFPAAAFHVQGRFQERDQWMAELLARYPDDLFLPLQMGEYAWHAGDIDAAQGRFEQVALIAEGMPVFQSIALYDQAVIDIDGRSYDTAAQHLPESIEVFPANAAAHVLLGDTHLLQGEGQQALDEYDLAIGWLPEYGAQLAGDGAEFLRAVAEARRGLALALLGDEALADQAFQEAENLARELVRLTPDWPQAHLALGAVLYSMGEDLSASDAFERAAGCDVSFERVIEQTRQALDRLRMAALGQR